MLEQTQNFIKVTEHKKPDASVLLEIQLNNPSKLNVLNLEMILDLNKLVKDWEKRDDLSLVFIHSAGDRAFCAGGDVAQVYHSILESKKQGEDPALAVLPFFKTEYETNYKLYHFPKPIVTWGHGFVMGGGMGLLMSSSYPVLTESSLLSMPEISIGFFPDVGASYFLNTIDKGMGLYLALTACRLNAVEASYLKLSPWLYPHQEKQNVFDFLLDISFEDRESFQKQFEKQYRQIEFVFEQDNWIKGFEKEICELVDLKDVKAVYDYLSVVKREDKKWELNRNHFLKASPTSLAVLFEQLKRSRNAKKEDLKFLLERETAIALHTARRFDFPEGVRAMLIDKDKKPQWKPDHIKDLDFSEISAYFKPLDSWDCSLNV